MERIELVTVLSSPDMVVISIAKSILEDAGIKFFAKNESIQNLFGLGGMGYNPITGPVQIQVDPEDEETAKTLLEELTK